MKVLTCRMYMGNFLMHTEAHSKYCCNKERNRLRAAVEGTLIVLRNKPAVNLVCSSPSGVKEQAVAKIPNNLDGATLFGPSLLADTD